MIKLLSKKHNIYLIILIVLICFLFSLCESQISPDKEAKDDSKKGNDISVVQKQEVPEIPLVMEENGSTPAHPDSVIAGTEEYYKKAYLISNPDDYNCIVNKTYNLQESYEPSDLVKITIPFAVGRTDDVRWLRKAAAEALEEMYNGACENGFKIYAASGYRSYNIQKVLFSNKIAERGSVEAANEYNAMPGQSEHQLGLAVDLTLESLGYKLDSNFGTTEEGKWLMENAYKYGFILRYPADKTDITGYKYEPWHYRYVGKKLAKYIYSNDLTLEEYYEL